MGSGHWSGIFRSWSSVLQHHHQAPVQNHRLAGNPGNCSGFCCHPLKLDQPGTGGSIGPFISAPYDLGNHHRNMADFEKKLGVIIVFRQL